MIAYCLISLTALAAGADVAVVCPREFRSALAPWLAHRADQGHTFAIVDNRLPNDVLRSRLKALQAGGLKFVLLVGDVPEVEADPLRTATHHLPAKINVRWGSEPHLASDFPLSDLDGDDFPDVAVGRLPVDSAEELRTLVAKILAYERSTDFGSWRQRVNFVAGVGGFGALADAAIEAAAKKLIADEVPPTITTSMTYASWQSPYCPDPRQLRQTSVERLNEGCLFWVYIGHGNRRHVDRMALAGHGFPILEAADVPRLQARAGSPIACFLACYTGAFDHREDCLAEEMLRAPGGPVAVLAGSRVTMPYAMSVLGLALLETNFVERPRTLGEALLLAKRRTLDDRPKSVNRASLDSLAQLVSPAPVDLRAERVEHLYLFNLLGDPLLRLPHVEPVELQAASSAQAGETLEVRGVVPFAGQATLELVARRDTLRFRPPRRDRPALDDETLANLSDTYRQANDPRWCSTKLQLTAGEFTHTLAIPKQAHGPCHVRLFLSGTRSSASGATEVEVNDK